MSRLRLFTSGLVLGCLLLLCFDSIAATPAVDLCSLDPQCSQANIKGHQLYNNGKFEEALIAFQDAYSRRPHAMLLMNIGRCQHLLQRYKDALASYKEVQSRKALGELPAREQKILSMFIGESTQLDTGVPRLLADKPTAPRAKPNKVPSAVAHPASTPPAAPDGERIDDLANSSSATPPSLYNTIIDYDYSTINNINNINNGNTCTFYGNNNVCGDSKVVYHPKGWLWALVGVGGTALVGLVVGVSVAKWRADNPAYRIEF